MNLREIIQLLKDEENNFDTSEESSSSKELSSPNYSTTYYLFELQN